MGQHMRGKRVVLPGLTDNQSQRVRGLLRQALAERGFEAVVYAGHLKLADGRQFGLSTLGSLCHTSGLGEGAWPGLVNRYVDDVLMKYPDAPPPLTPDQIRAGVHLRLVPLDLMDPRMHDCYRYAPRLGAGFAELLVHAEDDFVRFLNDEDVGRVGYEELRALGLDRLRDIRPDECELVRGNGAEAHVVRGESGFIASKALILPEIMRIVGGRRMRWPDGVLLAVPNRHELIFAPVDDALVDNLAAIGFLADYDHEHGHAPITPVVHWWRDGALAPVFDPTGPAAALHEDVPAEFLELYRRGGHEAA